MNLTAIKDVIPESNIIIFSPHFDDVLFMLGGYINEMKQAGLLSSKKFHVIIIFSRSNYLAGTGAGNFDTSLDRVKLATGKRLLEDQNCIDELLGRFNYTYELLGEDECFTRGKSFADSEMEFPHGMFEDFDADDHKIFDRMEGKVREYAKEFDTALIFPMAFKEHIDHFIVREAAIKIAGKKNSGAAFYFQEDKPYGGISDEKETARVDSFINAHKLKARTYECDGEKVISLAFTHYISQVEEVYKTGIRNRGAFLQKEMKSKRPCDRIYLYPR